VPDETSSDLGSDCWRKPITLTELATERLKLRKLFFRFDAFRHSRESEVVREGYDGTRDLYAMRIRRDVAYKRTVDFQNPERKPSQVTQ
jgi:hypothetical protein